MINLIKIELKKMAGKKRIIALGVTILLLSVAFTAFVKFVNNDGLADKGTVSEEEKRLEEEYKASTDWKERYEIQMEMNKQLESVFGEEKVALENSLIQYSIDNEIAPAENKEYDVYNYLSVFLGLGIVFILISALIYSDILNIEYKNATEKIIYTKPHSRGKIIAAKYIASTIIVTVTLLLFLLTAYVTGGLVFTFDGADITEVFYFNHKVMAESRIIYILLKFAGVYLSSLFMGSLSFALSLLTRSKMVGVGVSCLLYMTGAKILSMLYEKGLTWTKYIFAYYSNIGRFINTPIPKDLSLSIALISLILTIGALIVAGGYLTEKKDI